VVVVRSRPGPPAYSQVRDAVPGWRGISLVVGVMFGSLHLPNPVLAIATFVGGIAMAEIFARYRNIWILALGQALASTLIFGIPSYPSGINVERYATPKNLLHNAGISTHIFFRDKLQYPEHGSTPGIEKFSQY
jgi:hypothetical protein